MTRIAGKFVHLPIWKFGALGCALVWAVGIYALS